MGMASPEREFEQIQKDLNDEDPITRVQAILNLSAFVRDYPSFKSEIITLLQKAVEDLDEDVSINASNLIKYLETTPIETLFNSTSESLLEESSISGQQGTKSSDMPLVCGGLALIISSFFLNFAFSWTDALSPIFFMILVLGVILVILGCISFFTPNKTKE